MSGAEAAPAAVEALSAQRLLDLGQAQTDAQSPLRWAPVSLVTPAIEAQSQRLREASEVARHLLTSTAVSTFLSCLALESLHAILRELGHPRASRRSASPPGSPRSSVARRRIT